MKLMRFPYTCVSKYSKFCGEVALCLFSSVASDAVGITCTPAGGVEPTPCGRGTQFCLPPAQHSGCVVLQPAEIPGKWGFPVEEKQI